MVRVVSFFSAIFTFIPARLEEMPVARWKRYWVRKKSSLSEWGRDQKMSVFELFTRPRVSSYYDKGNTSVCNN